MKKRDIPIVYLWIHYKLQKTGKRIMKNKEIVSIIRRNIRLPNTFNTYSIICEMDKYGLIERINKKMGYRISEGKHIVEEPFF